MEVQWTGSSPSLLSGEEYLLPSDQSRHSYRPLSRLTYCAYLIHPLVIWLNFRNMEVEQSSHHDPLTPSYVLQVPFHASVITIAWQYVGNLGLSYAAALLLSLLFEAPFLNLQRIIGI